MPSRKSNTRAAQGSGTIRQRKDGRWEARYTLGRNPGTGKQIQKSVYGDTQGEVRKKLAQVVVDVDGGTYVEPSKLTVGSWLDIWLEEYVKISVKPLTYHAYKTQCNNHMKPAFGAVKLSALNAPTIQKLYNNLHKGREGKPGLSAKTIRNLHGVLHSAMKQALELRYIKNNPSVACRPPDIIKKQIKPLEEAEISTFLKAIEGHKFETVYLVALFCGARQAEILGLTWDCVDFKNGTILISKQLIKDKNNGQYYLSTNKNDKSRRITAATYVMELMKKHRRAQMEMRFKAGELWTNDDNLCFTNELGAHLSHVTVYKNFKRLVASLGLPGARFHDLRHSYAVAALSSGDDVKTVQENLGHHTAAFTLDVYGHVSEKMKRDSAERMDAFIKSVKMA